MITVHSHSEITIRRPSGEIEVATRPEKLNAALFARLKAGTKAAGRGDCLSYTTHTKQVAEPEGYRAAVAAERAYDASAAAIYGAMDHKAN